MDGSRAELQARNEALIEAAKKNRAESSARLKEMENDTDKLATSLGDYNAFSSDELGKLGFPRALVHHLSLCTGVVLGTSTTKSKMHQASERFWVPKSDSEWLFYKSGLAAAAKDREDWSSDSSEVGLEFGSIAGRTSTQDTTAGMEVHGAGNSAAFNASSKKSAAKNKALQISAQRSKGSTTVFKSQTRCEPTYAVAVTSEQMEMTEAAVNTFQGILDAEDKRREIKHFLEKYGTHFRTRIELGGIWIQELSYTHTYEAGSFVAGGTVSSVAESALQAGGSVHVAFWGGLAGASANASTSQEQTETTNLGARGSYDSRSEASKLTRKTHRIGGGTIDLQGRPTEESFKEWLENLKSKVSTWSILSVPSWEPIWNIMKNLGQYQGEAKAVIDLMEEVWIQEFLGMKDVAQAGRAVELLNADYNSLLAEIGQLEANMEGAWRLRADGMKFLGSIQKQEKGWWKGDWILDHTKDFDPNKTENAGLYDFRPHGQCTAEWGNGDRYEGAWKNGEKHGRGRLTSRAGTDYTSEFHNNMATGVGQGKMVWEEHSVTFEYVGQFIDGRIRGKGKLTERSTTDEYTYEGDFAVFSKAPKSTWLGWLGSSEHPPRIKHGFGKCTWSGGIVYEGQWDNNKRHGQGVFSRPGVKYEGQFMDDKKHGVGTSTDRSGASITGVWKNDEQIGAIADFVGVWKCEDRCFTILPDFNVRWEWSAHRDAQSFTTEKAVLKEDCFLTFKLRFERDGPGEGLAYWGVDLPTANKATMKGYAPSMDHTHTCPCTFHRLGRLDVSRFFGTWKDTRTQRCSEIVAAQNRHGVAVTQTQAVFFRPDELSAEVTGCEDDGSFGFILTMPRTRENPAGQASWRLYTDGMAVVTIVDENGTWRSTTCHKYTHTPSGLPSVHDRCLLCGASSRHRSIAPDWTH